MELRLPNITANDENVVITLWYVKENDSVSKDQDLVEVMTDKATFSVASPCDGLLSKINKLAGEEIVIGEAIAEIQEIE
ncbi:MAG: hypothetical protein ISS33_03475 [Candidatus Omnitrophica bacterium]|nr:hypothetical protein [Candidatus Omnitrophota bacterium]